MEEEKKEVTNNKNAYIALTGVVVILAAAAAFLLFKGNGTDEVTERKVIPPPGINQAQNNQQTGKQLFKDTQEYQYAYQIYPGDLSTDTKTALAGFSMKTTDLSDGSTQVDLSATNPAYQSQSYVVKKGYILYFIEMNLQDDNKDANKDRIIRDDTAVLVDKNGYIVK